MEDIRVTTISEQEKEEVESIFEYMNSIKILMRTLSEENELYKENSDFYQRLVDDYNDYNKKYVSWWKEIRKKYELLEEKADKYYLNFEEHTIYQMC